MEKEQTDMQYSEQDDAIDADVKFPSLQLHNQMSRTQ